MKRGQAGLVNVFIGLMVVILVAVSVVIPAVQGVITSGNYTGTLATVLNLIPLLLVIALVLVIVGLYQTGGKR